MFTYLSMPMQKTHFRGSVFETVSAPMSQKCQSLLCTVQKKRHTAELTGMMSEEVNAQAAVQTVFLVPHRLSIALPRSEGSVVAIKHCSAQDSGCNDGRGSGVQDRE